MKLEKLISQKGLVLQSPRAEEIIARAKSSDKPLKIFYGETYDSDGNTIDSMKYYFFVSNFSKSLEEEGYKTNPIILIADIAACRNVSESLNVKYIELGEERGNFVKNIRDIYKLNLEVIKMSDYIYTDEFQNKLDEIISICRNDSELMKKIEKSVPESKVEIERKKGFAYSFDEITTIIDLDIKVGPPREDLYDNIARNIAAKEGFPGVMSLFLTPTFPLGKNWAYFFANEGIEDHGITAYKAGSKRLQDYRILPGKTSPEQAKRLIDKSFISTNPKLPNPALDIGIISEMARKNLEKEDTPITLHNDFYSGKIKPEELKEKVYEKLKTNILSKF